MSKCVVCTAKCWIRVMCMPQLSVGTLDKHIINLAHFHAHSNAKRVFYQNMCTMENYKFMNVILWHIENVKFLAEAKQRAKERERE